MSRPARIMPKVVEPLSFDHDGWFSEGFGNETFGFTPNFQMVPRRGDRFIIVLIEGEECIVSSRNASIATVTSPLQDASSTPNRVVLRPLVPTAISTVVMVHGVQTGRTQIDVSSTGGKTLGTVEISVKDEITKTYRLWGLKDIVRRTTRTPVQMISIMNNVATLYKAQANVKLVQLDAPLDLLFKEDLGDPISSPNLLTIKVAVGIKLSKQAGADFDIVSTWDIPDAVGQTNPISGVCLVEDYKPGLDLQETSTFAHELGHAFSIGGHTTRTKMMMSGDGTDGFQMRMLDMDSINPTGQRA